MASGPRKTNAPAPAAAPTPKAPAAPAAKAPTALVVETPAKPPAPAVAEAPAKPAEPVAAKPAEPVVAKPAEPVVAKPEKPAKPASVHAAATLENPFFSAASKSLQAFSSKAMEAYQANAAASVEYVQALANVRSVSDAIALQSEHMRKQYETLTGPGQGACRARPAGRRRSRRAADGADRQDVQVALNGKGEALGLAAPLPGVQSEAAWNLRARRSCLRARGAIGSPRFFSRHSSVG